MTTIETTNIKLFDLSTSRELGLSVARKMGTELTKHEVRDFEDGEHKIRSLENVRNADVFVIASLYSGGQQSVNDKLCKLLFFIGSLWDAGAAQITVIAPYLCYMRKDRKTKPRDPVTARYVAQLFEAVNIHRIVSLDVHNLQAYQNAFRCKADHLEAQSLFTDYFVSQVGNEELAVMSPDSGGVKRAEQFRQRLERELNKSISLIFLEKQRSKGVVSGETVIGHVEGKSVIIIDDLISSGTTLARAAKACMNMNARKVYAAATHGAFVGKAADVLKNDALQEVVITNSIPAVQLSDEIKEQ